MVTAEEERERIVAEGLSEAQKRALISCAPWDVCLGAGIASAFVERGFLQDSTILDDGVELTPFGLAVRNHLTGANNGG